MDYKKIFDLILDENDFTVGGGSSSAIVGAMACGLMGMVANLSKGKDYGYSDKEYDNIIKELNKAKANFLQGAVDDNKAYMLIVNAYKLPKSSEEEKEINRVLKYHKEKTEELLKLNDDMKTELDIQINESKKILKKSIICY